MVTIGNTNYTTTDKSGEYFIGDLRGLSTDVKPTEIDGKKVSKFDLEPVICLNTGVIYDNNKVAMKETGVNSGAIKRNCRGFTKCAGKDENGKKLVWRFAKDI